MVATRRKYLLDSLSVASIGAYSTRRLSSNYTGPLLNVRRISDNAVRDIYPLSDGSLDVYDLTTFCGASGTGKVATWYDQSGLGRHATQATVGNQPGVFNSGAIITVGTTKVPSLGFAGGTMNLNNSFSGLYTAGSSTIHVAWYSTYVTARQFLFSECYNSAGFMSVCTDNTSFNTPAAYYKSNAGTTYLAESVTTSNNIVGSPTVATWLDSGSVVTPYVNGRANSTLPYTRSGNTLTPNATYIGAVYSSSTIVNPIVGNLGEIILIPTVVNNNDFYLLRTSAYNYYGITGGI